MKNAHKATFILYAGVLGTGGALKLAVSNTAAGTKSQSTSSASSMDLAFPHYWVSGVTAAASCDVYTKTSTTSSTMVISGTGDGKVYIFEVEAAKMGKFTSTAVEYDAKYLSVVLDAGTDFYSYVCILTGYRYQEDAPATDLV